MAMPSGNVSLTGMTHADAVRVDEIQKLAYQAVDVVQRLVLASALHRERRQWLDANAASVDYSLRMAKFTRDQMRLQSLHNEWVRLARACRVQAIRLSPSARAKLVAIGLDYSATTGDSLDDLRIQWSAIFAGVNREKCPF